MKNENKFSSKELADEIFKDDPNKDNLVIVESPAKVRKISSFLGKGYTVTSSYGHIRELASPKDLTSDVPESAKKFGVDLDDNFKPFYKISTDKKRIVSGLKKQLKNAKCLYLATDLDREGESIAWHIYDELNPKMPVKRTVFNEITKEAIVEAFANTRDIDQNLVHAQESRRILDRLFGFELSRILWRKIGRRAPSAGRVQSPALRLLVEREKDRLAFVSADFSNICAHFNTPSDWEAKLKILDGKLVATSRDFNDDGSLTTEDKVVLDANSAENIVSELETCELKVADINQKPYKKAAPTPFTTSTLQQAASSFLGYNPSKTMSIAQKLYEQGLITYMRTDSLNLSSQAISGARKVIEQKFGNEFLPDKPLVYLTKSKQAQEAHEAIRPAGSIFVDPAKLSVSTDEEAKLYKLIYNRTLACQMKECLGQTTTLSLSASTKNHQCEFSAAGTVITFLGWTIVNSGNKNNISELGEQLPNVKLGDILKPQSFEVLNKSTTAPARYSESSLIKKLEALGIGRPSTYVTIINTLLDRYAFKKNNTIVPTVMAFSVINLLEKDFADYVNYDFTANMENDLDGIANGEVDGTKFLHDFYDTSDKSLHNMLEKYDVTKTNARDLEDLIRLENWKISVGTYGAFATDKETGKTNIAIPNETPPDEISDQMIDELNAKKNIDDKIIGVDPKTNENIYLKNGRNGAYLQLGKAVKNAKGAFKKMPTAPVLSFMSDPPTLQEALQSLSLPRNIGMLKADISDLATLGDEIFATKGPYGPYIYAGKERRSIENDKLIFSITYEEALDLLKKPKSARGRAKSPDKVLGKNAKGQDIVLKVGRYGPYVTDGSVNKPIKKGTDLNSLTLEDALKLFG